jgi:V-type H+-transporting ATPase subunit H
MAYAIPIHTDPPPSRPPSTFDVYAAEVHSGKLEWSPPHLSDRFWKSNITRFQEKDYELLKILISLLTTSQEPLVLAIAASDLGQYIKFANAGKAVWNNLGAKTLVMSLMNHSDEKVRYQALLAVQKYMAHAWE